MTTFCSGCGEAWTRDDAHNCGWVLVSKDRLRTLLEAERERDEQRLASAQKQVTDA